MINYINEQNADDNRCDCRGGLVHYRDAGRRTAEPITEADRRCSRTENGISAATAGWRARRRGHRCTRVCVCVCVDGETDSIPHLPAAAADMAGRDCVLRARETKTYTCFKFVFQKEKKTKRKKTLRRLLRGLPRLSSKSKNVKSRRRKLGTGAHSRSGDRLPVGCRYLCELEIKKNKKMARR